MIVIKCGANNIEASINKKNKQRRCSKVEMLHQLGASVSNTNATMIESKQK